MPKISYIHILMTLCSKPFQTYQSNADSVHRRHELGRLRPAAAFLPIYAINCDSGANV